MKLPDIGLRPDVTDYFNGPLCSDDNEDLYMIECDECGEEFKDLSFDIYPLCPKCKEIK